MIRMQPLSVLKIFLLYLTHSTNQDMLLLSCPSIKWINHDECTKFWLENCLLLLTVFNEKWAIFSIILTDFLHLRQVIWEPSTLILTIFEDFPYVWLVCIQERLLIKSTLVVFNEALMTMLLVFADGFLLVFSFKSGTTNSPTDF